MGGWSTEDKDTPVRACVDLNTQDATANIYLELAMVLIAGMDGMKNGKKLRPMIDDAETEPLPESLSESLDLLKRDETLLSVLGERLSTAYIAVQESEVENEKSLEDEVLDAFNKA